MINRSFLFGLGSGLIVSSLLVFGLLSLEPDNDKQTTPVEGITLSQDEWDQQMKAERQKGYEQGKREAKPQENAPDQVYIFISRGYASKEVTKLLHEAGLVEDENKFNTRIEARGKEKSIKAGTFGISTNASVDEIIDIITK